ncbi:CU044_2847 family protein [Streptomyces marispadix]|uniref:Trypsin-co-occurring domain-containing protein n=1 Tax=Streptomyces marispadix TaxID=2922868 RepID=A0ABS9SUV0_9ACTN|nr:CU044_2847 family protein [Streptomyces marispadix]MCH6160047.1 hypothetical protein [Streptomyces marispadix]
MTQYAELTLSDDTAIRLELEPVGELPAAETSVDADLPSGVGGATPVGRGTVAAVTLARETLRTTLRPLGPLLQEVNDSLTAAGTPPDEVTVEFGLTVGQDLKLGIVGTTGNATLKVAATWRPSTSRG